MSIYFGIVHRLNSKEIPCKHQSLLFFILKSNYVVTDVLAFFSLSFDSSDFSAFSRIFYKTASCLKRNMLSRIPTSPLMQGESYFDRMVQLCDENQNTGRIRYIAMMIEKLRSMQPLKAMECILYQIGYLSYLEFTSGTWV